MTVFSHVSPCACSVVNIGRLSDVLTASSIRAFSDESLGCKRISWLNKQVSTVDGRFCTMKLHVSLNYILNVVV
jgi:hypothetical protein